MNIFQQRISGFILTRDSWILFWGKIVGLAGLVVSGAIQPASLGLTEKQAHVAMAVCSAIMAASAQFSNSSLPSKAEAAAVSKPPKDQP